MLMDKLESIYSEDDAVRAICDHMAERSRNQNETKLRRIRYLLRKEGNEFPKSDLIAAFRKLAEAQCGTYVEGRHGWPSRFVWHVKSMLVADAAQGLVSNDSIEDSEIDDDADELDSGLIEHSFVLRPDLTISIELPEDLTPRESSRLSLFMESLAFEETDWD